MSQFRPPSQPGWDQSDPNQQPFPQQPPPYTPLPQPQQYEQWQQLPQSQPLPVQSTGYYPWPQQQADVPPQQQQWQQQSQQPSYTQPGQYQQPQFFQQVQQVPPQQRPWQQLSVTPMQAQKPPKRPMDKKLGIGCGIVAVFLVLVIAISVAAGSNNQSSSSADSSTPVAQTTTSSDQSTPVDQPTSIPTTQPTTAPTPQPTVSAADLEALYKATTTNTTVTTLDKDGNADSGKDVHFTAAILNFVKDGSGNTAGANLDDPNGASGVVQIAFPANTDLSQLNAGDIVEVWATDGGTVSGQNAFGATIQEVVLSANYLTDKTTGYQTH